MAVNGINTVRQTEEEGGQQQQDFGSQKADE